MIDDAIVLDSTVLQNYDKAEKIEWLLTNGIGGYASSTVIGENTRGYHGLLIASLPHLKRILLLSKIEDEIEIHGRVFQLSTNRYPNTIYPRGYNYLQKFELNSGVSFVYNLENVILRKSIKLANGKNVSIITYEVLKSFDDVALTLRPLINCRDHHLRTREGGVSFGQEVFSSKVIITPSPGLADIYLSYSDGRYTQEEVWYRDMIYEQELERGLAFSEDHFCPGRIEVKLKVGKEFVATASTDDSITFHDSEVEIFYDHFFLSRLRKASDQFIIRGPFGEGIIAGYHWFSEWGRDTAISIPGLLLLYGKNKSARNIITRYLSLCRHGIIPLQISERGDPIYSSVDTSLWFIYTIYKYYTYTMDDNFIKSIFPIMKGIMNYYIKGTDFGIRMNELGLIECNNSGMTWMDAVVDGVPATDRRGQCVEVNALWYNALKTMESFARLIGEDPTYYSKLAGTAKRSFDNFWYNKGGYLYDCINSNGKDESLRPNQLFAISLPFPILARQRWGDIISIIEERLLTPYGLRTLDPLHRQYRGRCQGDQRQRDLAYHNGTVWAWLLGPFISAKVRAGYAIDPDTVIRSLEKHMLDAGLGTISEIFDGDSPYTARGCIAQAWSVAEIARALHEGRIKLKQSRI